MSEGRDDWLYGKWLDASQQFNYFATGICLAMLGYVSTHIPAPAFTSPPGILAILATVLLTGAVICGVKHAEATISFIQITGRRVHREEEIKEVRKASAQTGHVAETLAGTLLTPQSVQQLLRSNTTTIEKLKEREAYYGEHAETLYQTRTWLAVIALFAIILSQGLTTK